MEQGEKWEPIAFLTRGGLTRECGLALRYAE